MESLYQVGDTVKIKKLSLENGDDYRYGLNQDMVEQSGKSFEIKDVFPATYPQSKLPDDGFKYKLKDMGWTWVSSMFEGPSTKKSAKSKNKKSKIKISFLKKKKIKFNFSL